jgi:molecular chaperone GrpE (heat shock protein)
MAEKNKNKIKPKNQEQLQELTDLLQRTQASFENYRKQTEKRVENILQHATKDIIIQLLPIIDNFELAIKNTGDLDKKHQFVQGIELINQQLNRLLEDNNVKTIESKNKQFNPHLHEALLKVADKTAENTIIEVLQKGYVIEEHVIRPAKVKLSAGIKKTENNNNNNTKEDN